MKASLQLLSIVVVSLFSLPLGLLAAISIWSGEQTTLRETSAPAEHHATKDAIVRSVQSEHQADVGLWELETAFPWGGGFVTLHRGASLPDRLSIYVQEPDHTFHLVKRVFSEASEQREPGFTFSELRVVTLKDPNGPFVHNYVDDIEILYMTYGTGSGRENPVEPAIYYWASESDIARLTKIEDPAKAFERLAHKKPDLTGWGYSFAIDDKRFCAFFAAHRKAIPPDESLTGVRITYKLVFHPGWEGSGKVFPLWYELLADKIDVIP